MRQQAEEHQRPAERLDPRVLEAQRGHAAAGLLVRPAQRGQHLRAISAISGQSLDVQQTSVGGVADLLQRGEILEPLADAEIPGVVDRRLGPQCSPFLVVLLDARVLVIDVERGTTPSVMTTVLGILAFLEPSDALPSMA